MQTGERGENVRFGEVAVTGIQIVVTTHRRRGQPPRRVLGELASNPVAQQAPYRRMRELGFDLAGTAEHADQRLVDQPHVLRIVTAPPPTSFIRDGDEFRELIDRRVLDDRLHTLKLRDSTRTSTHPRGRCRSSSPNRSGV